jgi:VWFA-related protein
MMMLGQQTQQGQQAIPDAPRPQVSLPASDSVKPGMGTTPNSTGDATDSAAADSQDDKVPSSLPATPPPAAQNPGSEETVIPTAGEGRQAFTLRAVNVNFVEVPFTVKDNKGRLVPGIKPREVQVFENNLRQHISLFTVDPWPLSVALVVDQSLPDDVMRTVNRSLAAIPGAFTNYDEVAVFTYNNGPQMRTDFTGAQSPRLSFTLQTSQTSGREVLMPLGGPLSQTNVLNNQVFDPNTAPQRNNRGIELNPPREVHTLNDAILEAAKALSKTERGRRRVIYVISDGKEYGSKAKFKEVVQYLQTHRIAVFGTLVGDSSLPVIGFLDNIHVPLTMRDNILRAYVTATGGSLEAQFRQKNIEQSFINIAKEVRTQYTVGYYSHEPMIDGKFRTIEVKVMRPDLTVLAKKGYFPSVNDARPTVAPVASH